MVSNSTITHLKASTSLSNQSLICSQKMFLRIRYSFRVHAEKKFPRQSLGDKWKLNDINTNVLQDRLNLWLSKTQNFLNDVTSPLVKSSHSSKPNPRNEIQFEDIEDIFVSEQTVDGRMPNGILSLAAVTSIEQFSRMNGLTGRKMQKIFKALVPESVYADARNLVEYCCFRYLSRDSSNLHPSLKEPAFQQLIFITMLAWENPYAEELSHNTEKSHFQGKLVSESAFVRFAPALSGVADHTTAHNLFKALAGDEKGFSLSLWLTYINELVKVHRALRMYQTQQFSEPSEEIVLCFGSNRRRPVLKWDNGIAWPGKLTLTDKAMYFEAAGLLQEKKTVRMDLTRHGLKVEKTKVGPLGSALFDSAVSVSSGPGSETWLLEFVDLGGEMRRDVWHSFISEVVSLHKFIREYGPEDRDGASFHVYGVHKGNERAMASVVNSIARLQVLQFMRKMPDDPIKLVQFSYSERAPYGDIVRQTLAVNYWGGPIVTGSVEAKGPQARGSGSTNEGSNHVFDIDGSVYLHRWMRSPSWSSSASISFWKNSSTRQSLVLSKNLVVADSSLVQRAAEIVREKCEVAETTQATINAATIEGIPSNIDLFKELLLPLTIMARNFGKLRRWEEPTLTLSFLALTYTAIFRNLLPYVFPGILLILSATMLLIKGLREQGRLGRSFGKVTIRDQPPSNTIQKIIAVKDAMRDLENYLQHVNVTLLKIRSIFLSGHSQVTTEVALVLLFSGTVLLIVPFKYVLSFLLFDLFTRELEFRREMVKAFTSFLRDRWQAVPAAPVEVLPYESEGSVSDSLPKLKEGKAESQRTQSGNKSR